MQYIIAKKARQYGGEKLFFQALFELQVEREWRKQKNGTLLRTAFHLVRVKGHLNPDASHPRQVCLDGLSPSFASQTAKHCPAAPLAFDSSFLPSRRGASRTLAPPTQKGHRLVSFLVGAGKRT